MGIERCWFGSIVCVMGIASIGAAASPAQAAASLAPLTGLPDPAPGILQRGAFGVSGDGAVVVGTFGGQAFRWTAAGGMQGLGWLPAPSGGNSSAAFAASADGAVVVGYSTSALGGEPFRYTTAGGMVGLGFSGDGAFAVSADGSVIAGTRMVPGSFPEAFRWTAAGGVVGLGFINPGDVLRSDARGISGDGTVVVGSGEDFTGAIGAFRWTAAGGLVPLGDLPGGIARSIARGTNSDGSVVVGQGRSADGNEAFRWTAAGGMTGLGDLPGGSFSSDATAVTPDGSVIVGRGVTALGAEAMRWTQATGMQRVADLLLSAGIDPAEPANGGWTKLTLAYAVSADGNTIVGVGERNGDDEAFVAVLPEPVVPGDFDSDGDVDGADFVAWQTNFPKPSGATLADGDADSDGDVDGADFVVWQTNFPYPPNSAASLVPEPNAIILSLFGTLALIVRFRRNLIPNNR